MKLEVTGHIGISSSYDSYVLLERFDGLDSVVFVVNARKGKITGVTELFSDLAGALYTRSRQAGKGNFRKVVGNVSDMMDEDGEMITDGEKPL